MKKYTRKQIEEAIKHWQGILKKMNESRSNVGEQKYKIGFDVVTEMYTKDGRFLGIMEKPQFDKMMKKIEKKYGVKTEVVSYNGPGGGWPYVEIIGDKESLKAVYEIWYCNGDVDSCDSFEDVFKEAIPVGINEAAVVDEYA